MSKLAIEEIKSSLQNKDYPLAVRRMLDISRDVNNNTLMRRAIELAARFHEMEEGQRPAIQDPVLDLLGAIGSEELLPEATERALVIRAENISKRYKKGNFSLKPISLDIATGEIIGVVGENGNGKTTLLECLSGKLSIDDGELSYPLLRKSDFYSIKHNVAFIPQRIPRWYGKLKDNLHFSAAISEVYDEDNHLLVDFILERLNLNRFAELTWDQISSGYRTRFEIARILLQKPTLLILDEPLANLDIKAQETILMDLRFISKSIRQPLAIILSSQQLHEVEKVADKVIMIRNGACIFSSDEAADGATVVELESDMEHEQLIGIMQQEELLAQFNGGFYTIESKSKTAQDILRLLMERNIPISYFRDITHSTKRYFN